MADLDVRWLGHASLVIDIGGIRVLTDPVLRSSPGMLSRRGPNPEVSDWEGSSSVLISHLHLDHADVPSLKRLDVPVAAMEENRPWVRKVKKEAFEASSHEWRPLPDLQGRDSEVEVLVTRAIHHSRPMPHRPNGACGFLLRTSEHVVWFAGDTDLWAGMEELVELAGRPIDLALVPIAGWGPKLSAGHMGPKEAAEACRRLEVKHAMAIHHDTFHPVGWPKKQLSWMGAPYHAFVTALEHTAPDTTLIPCGMREQVSIPALLT